MSRIIWLDGLSLQIIGPDERYLGYFSGSREPANEEEEKNLFSGLLEVEAMKNPPKSEIASMEWSRVDFGIGAVAMLSGSAKADAVRYFISARS